MKNRLSQTSQNQSIFRLESVIEMLDTEEFGLFLNSVIPGLVFSCGQKRFKLDFKLSQ